MEILLKVKAYHFVDASHFMDGGIVNNEHRVGEWPLVHVGEQARNKLTENVARDGVFNNLEVYNTVKGQGGEYGIFGSMIEKLKSSCTFATQ